VGVSGIGGRPAGRPAHSHGRAHRCAGGSPAGSVWPQRGPARKAPALVAPSLALLPEPLQSPAHPAGRHFLLHRGHEGHRGHFPHGEPFRGHPLYPGIPLQQGGGQAQGNGQQHGHGAAPGFVGRGRSPLQPVLRRPSPGQTRPSPGIADPGTGARGRGAPLRRGHDPGGPAGALRQGFVRQPGGHDRGIPAGGEIRRGQAGQHQPGGTGQYSLHGYQRGERLRPGGGHHYRQPDLFRRPGGAGHGPGSHGDRLPGRGKQGELAAGALHAGDDPPGAAH